MTYHVVGGDRPPARYACPTSAVRDALDRMGAEARIVDGHVEHRERRKWVRKCTVLQLVEHMGEDGFQGIWIIQV